MSVTRADLRAARMGIEKLAAAPAAPGGSTWDRLTLGKEGAKTRAAMLNSEEYKKLMIEKIGDGTGEAPDAYAKKRADWAKVEGQRHIAAKIAEMKKGANVTGEQIVAGGIGAGLGGLLGAAFGGGKGAVVGTLLGGLAMWAMEKFDLTPDFAKGFIKDAAQATPGLGDNKEQYEKAMAIGTETVAKGKVEPGQAKKVTTPTDAVKLPTATVVGTETPKATSVFGTAATPDKLAAAKAKQDAAQKTADGYIGPATEDDLIMAKAKRQGRVNPASDPLKFGETDPNSEFYNRGTPNSILSTNKGTATASTGNIGVTPAKMAAAKARQDAAQAKADTANAQKASTNAGAWGETDPNNKGFDLDTVPNP